MSLFSSVAAWPLLLISVLHSVHSFDQHLGEDQAPGTKRCSLLQAFRTHVPAKTLEDLSSGLVASGDNSTSQNVSHEGDKEDAGVMAMMKGISINISNVSESPLPQADGEETGAVVSRGVATSNDSTSDVANAIAMWWNASAIAVRVVTGSNMSRNFTQRAVAVRVATGSNMSQNATQQAIALRVTTDSNMSQNATQQAEMEMFDALRNGLNSSASSLEKPKELSQEEKDKLKMKENVKKAKAKKEDDKEEYKLEMEFKQRTQATKKSTLNRFGLHPVQAFGFFFLTVMFSGWFWKIYKEHNAFTW